MATPTAKRKLFSLNVEQKREICIYHIENPGKTQKQIAEFFCAKFGEVVGKRTIGNILANIQLWMNQVTHPGSAKRLRYAKYGRLEEALQLWYADARMTNLEISDSVLKEKAKEIGSELGMDDLKLKYSNGWLHRFKNRCASKSFMKSYNPANSTQSVTPLSEIPLSLGTKLAILAELDKGRTDQFVAKLFSVTKKVVRSIRMCSEEIRSQAMGQNLLIAEDRHQEKVEEFINGWILTNVPADKHVSATFVRQMAQNMYKSMAKMAGDDPHKFRASKVWLGQFVEKYGLSHLTWIEESTPTSTPLPLVAETEMAKTDVEQDCKIVSAVEPHKCLYDVGLPDYKDGLLKDNIWKDIANTLGLPAEIVKARWHNLLSDYQKSVWSVNKIQVFNKMAFLKPHLIRDGGDQPVASTEKSSFSVKSEVLSSDEEYADTIDMNPSDIGQANMSLADAYKRSRFPLVTYEDHDDKADNEELDMKVEEEDSLLPDDPNNSASVSSFQIPPLESSCTVNKSVGPASRKKKAEKKMLTSDISGVDPDLEYFKGFLSLVKELSSKRKRQLFATFAQELFRHLDEQEKEETDSTDI
ncbi:uncharacterized protein LOC129922277 isoform X4 [Biomphalaria glabrata]|uniref:Uncharacterized protein LOC129922277 isoform X4 n=1 Tax=Biomphalaria glabrata TaxID=6526 RepID=A0A9W2YLJ9_BIOGL|nr:uncharacterized protein LOC129922277 isoform X4 [Biomphalaria glabrata]